MRLFIDENMPDCEKLADFLNKEFKKKTAYTWVGDMNTGLKASDPEETVYLTEDYLIAEKLEKMGKCSVFVQHDPESGFASGVSRIMTDPIEITEDYLWRIYDHYDGRPHVIGSDGVILLRESTVEDFEILHESNGEDATFEQDEILRERSAFEAYIKTAYSFYDFGYWTIVDIWKGKIIGWAGFSPAQDEEYGAELGYLILPAYRRKGFASRTVNICLNYGFGELDFHTVKARIKDSNAASIRTVLKAGFERSDSEEENADFHVYIKENKNPDVDRVMGIIGRKVTVTVDRPLGSFHPRYPDMYYPVNYGYIEGLIAGDGERQDAYILGVTEPVKMFKGVVIAVVHRYDDNEEKWVVAPENTSFEVEEIRESVAFAEQYFYSDVWTADWNG